jgi:hypothetical protein
MGLSAAGAMPIGRLMGMKLAGCVHMRILGSQIVKVNGVKVSNIVSKIDTGILAQS